MVNNDYTHWEMYAIGGSANPTINSQGNRYNAPLNAFAKEVSTLTSHILSFVYTIRLSAAFNLLILTTGFAFTGNKEGGHSCKPVEGLELEI